MRWRRSWGCSVSVSRLSSRTRSPSRSRLATPSRMTTVSTNCTTNCRFLNGKIIIFRGNYPFFLHFQQKTQEKDGHLLCNWQYTQAFPTTT